MVPWIAQKFLLDTKRRCSGTLTEIVDKLFFYAALHHAETPGEVLLDWEDQFIHLEMGRSFVNAAYAKSDEFQFGHLLTQMAGVNQEDIDAAYDKVKGQDEQPESGAEPTSQPRTPPSRRIGSLLVAAHIISPHMIGTVLRTQILERTLRVFSIGACHYTFEPAKTEPSIEKTELYPYMDHRVGVDELLFHAFIWRCPIKAINGFLDDMAQYRPKLRLDSNFEFPQRLAAVCRKDPDELRERWLEPVLGRSTAIADWIAKNSEERAFSIRFAGAFLLAFAGAWKVAKIR